MRLKAKDRNHFGTGENMRWPLESIFRQMKFQPFVFGTFTEMIFNVKAFIEVAVEYRVEHIGRSMAATTLDYVRATLNRMYTS